jgi:multiple sugar transport system substrate-binding protein
VSTVTAALQDGNDVRLVGRTFDGFQRAIGVQADQWSGGSVTARWIALPDLERLLLHDGAAQRGEFDLALVASDWIPQLVASGAIRPVDELLDVAPPADWPTGWAPSMRSLTRYRGSTYGLAFHDGPEMLIYRADLYDDAEERRAFEGRFGYPLAPPVTWQQFSDHAVHFTRPQDGLWGTVQAGLPDGHNNVYDFLLQLWSRGGEFLDAHDQPRFDSPEGLAALEFLGTVWNELGVVDPAARQWDSVASGTHFAAGEAALMVNWSGFCAMSAPPDSPTHGRIRCAPVPRLSESTPSVSLNVYWALVIAAGAPDPALAWGFMRHAASPAMDKVTSLSGATGTRLSTWRDDEVRATSPYYSVIEEVHAGVRTLPATPLLPGVVEILNVMVDEVINGRAEPAAALRRAGDAVRALPLGN